MRGLRERAMGKLGNKLNKAMPSLVNFAVDSDAGYNSLISTMREINKRRKVARRFVFIISVKPSSGPQ